MARRVHVEDGLVKYDADIWVYLGDGTASYEQIEYKDGRFVLRDASWASRPVVRVTYLGAQAYARHYNKQLPTLSQWRAGLAVIDSEKKIEPSNNGYSAVDAHTLMMRQMQNSDSAGAAGHQANQPPFKEWVVNPKAGDSTAVNKESDKNSWLAAWPATISSAPEERYPWEAFADAGFRTVIVPTS